MFRVSIVMLANSAGAELLTPNKETVCRRHIQPRQREFGLVPAPWLSFPLGYSHPQILLVTAKLHLLVWQQNLFDYMMRSPTVPKD